MSERLAASLGYLLIYNPTLTPPPDTSKDDEDAQEEAHILFYTSRDRVASRDRMLRQVGLAKALVNFSEIFSGEPCDNVHSQGKRLVSVSPEPDFWMHVCIEVARTPHQGKDKKKNGSNISVSSKGYHYHDDSVNDAAVRSRLLWGYEEYKLLCGTYAAALADGGAPTLQARLERFFTPWAWRWDIEDDLDLQPHLGIPVHPHSSSLAAPLSEFPTELPENMNLLLISPPYIIPFPDNQDAAIPQSLPRYLLSRLPPAPRPRPRSRRSSSKGKEVAIKTITQAEVNPNLGLNGTLNFLSGVGDVMNVKKWSWPTFGTGKQELSNPASTATNDEPESQKEVASDSRDIPPEQSSVEPPDPQANGEDDASTVQAAVDQAALEDAISSIHPHPVPETQQDVQFSVLTIYCSDLTDPLSIHRKKVFHLRDHDLILALVMDANGSLDAMEEDLKLLAARTAAFLRKVRELLDTLSNQDSINENKIAPYKEIVERPAYLIQHDEQVVSSQGSIPKSSSPYFLDQRELLVHSSPDIIEVFSRLMNPQRWIVTKRGLGSNDTIPGEIYLQVNRREASLVDANNEMEGAIRRWSTTDT